MSFLNPYMYYFHPGDEVAAGMTWTPETGTENPAYPMSNIADFSYALLAAPSKLNETAGAWQGASGAPQRVDGLLLWHDFDEAIDLFYEEESTLAGGWSSPLLQRQITVPARRADGYTMKLFVNLTTDADYTASGRQYRRIHAADPSALPIGLKVMLFSRIRTLHRDVSRPIRFRHHQFGIDMRTDAGHPWSFDLKSAPRVWSANGLFTAEDRTKIVEWHRSAGGIFSPVCFVPTPSSGEGMIVRFAGGPPGPLEPQIVVSAIEEAEIGDDEFEMQLAFEELTAGDPEWF